MTSENNNENLLDDEVAVNVDETTNPERITIDETEHIVMTQTQLNQ